MRRFWKRGRRFVLGWAVSFGANGGQHGREVEAHGPIAHAKTWNNVSARQSQDGGRVSEFNDRRQFFRGNDLQGGG